MDYIPAVSSRRRAGANHNLEVRFGRQIAMTPMRRKVQVGAGAGAFEGVKEVAFGQDNTWFLKNDGTVWAIGSNYAGALGNGTVDPFEYWIYPRSINMYPVQCDIEDVVSIKAGTYHVMALKADGTVWTWGQMWWNVLGIPASGPDNRNVITPTEVTGMAGAKEIASGAGTHFAIMEDGSVLVAGNNGAGQLGVGSRTNDGQPITEAQIDNVAKVCSQRIWGDYTFFLKADGTVWSCGGWDNDPVLGLGAPSSPDAPSSRVLTPRQLDVSDVKDIGIGDYHAFAIKDNGDLWGWGDGDNGTLGDPDLYDVDVYAPQFLGVSDVSQVDGGNWWSIILKDDGSLWTTGLSLGTLGYEAGIGDVQEWTDIGEVGVGSTDLLRAGYWTVGVIKDDCSVWVWGNTRFGKVNRDEKISDKWYRPSYEESILLPHKVNGGYDVLPFGASSVSTLGNGVLAQADKFWGWGDNKHGQLGASEPPPPMAAIPCDKVGG